MSGLSHRPFIERDCDSFCRMIKLGQEVHCEVNTTQPALVLKYQIIHFYQGPCQEPRYFLAAESFAAGTGEKEGECHVS